MNENRRKLVFGGGGALAAAVVSKSALSSLPDLVLADLPHTRPPAAPENGPSFRPVVTLNGWSLPWRMNEGVKEFHLVAEPVAREIAPGMTAQLWGYNGQSPGPTIEVVEGDRLRIFVTNRLPEHTTVHWHGQRVPNGMDGVGGLTQPQIPPGKTYVYEFSAHRSGTFMYHPHADEMTQMAMGMMGFWITHPRDEKFMAVDRDFVFLINAFDVVPGTSKPQVMTMTDFNLWTFNSRTFPGIDHLPCRQGDRVRVRVGNLSMTNHPIHLHGHDFVVTCTDGGWTPPAARWPEVSIDIGVGQMRAIEFHATEPGDWALHCHKSHHTMNSMNHAVPTMIGVPPGATRDLSRLVPGYMSMGERGMGEMGTMPMPLPANTLPMMSGMGPMGPLQMGGMFTVLKVREQQKVDDYSDPGWYRHPSGTVAYEWRGNSPAIQQGAIAPSRDDAIELRVQKPSAQGHQH